MRFLGHDGIRIPLERQYLDFALAKNRDRIASRTLKTLSPRSLINALYYKFHFFWRQYVAIGHPCRRGVRTISSYSR